LAIFDEAGMAAIGAKRDALTGYLVDVLDAVLTGVAGVHIITPRNVAERGAQVSLSFDSNGRAVFEALRNRGVIADWRTPSVIRLAPAPLYNSFGDVAALGQHLQAVIAEVMT
jgi:kynureninase